MKMPSVAPHMDPTDSQAAHMPTNNSQEWTRRLKDVMPWGSSTCSKAPKYAPDEPGVIVKGKGCRVWDADGREYIDYRNALGPITLGHQFPATDKAIREQLKQGIIFGQPHPLECEVAEMLKESIPCAEQVRFLKTGGEAAAACITLARCFTRRDHIIQTGYNGWLNALGAGGRVLPGRQSADIPHGVPACLSALHHTVRWNDIDQMRDLFQKLNGKVAAVVITPDYRTLSAGETFYPAVRKLADEHGALLVFDEIVLGFRIALGGAQEYFKIKPDLAVFAKGMANGMPLSAYVGRRDVMQKCQEAIISSTYGGETLSLAAAKAAIETYRKSNVVKHLWEMGDRLWKGFNRVCKQKGVPVRVDGLWPVPVFVFDDAPASFEDRFYRAAYRNGVCLYSSPYISFSHEVSDVDDTLDRLARAVTEL
jgi:glutamate-1-semialdehyde 2,1-aminomutase